MQHKGKVVQIVGAVNVEMVPQTKRAALIRGKEALKKAQAAANGAADMTLAEINVEIQAARQDRGKNE